MSITITPPACSSEDAVPLHSLARDGAFCFSDYDAAPAFSSFLPGIAGLNGTPLWCLYVNRAQAIASFGVQDKNNAIIEFLPANWAYQMVGLQGFRTFCMLTGEYYEPFSAVCPQPNGDVKTMRVLPDRLRISAVNDMRGLRCDVEYFSPPDQPLGALVRHVSLTNIGSAPTPLALLDGLPLILPAGISDQTLKAQRHITEAYAYVQLLLDRVPYFATKVAVHDEAEVSHVARGNFYAAWRIDGQHLRPIQPIIDPSVVFGGGQSLASPRLFIENECVNADQQVWENRLACALVPLNTTLEPGESIELFALIGTAPEAAMAERFVSTFKKPADFKRASEASKRTVEAVTAPAITVSRHATLDAYARQNFLDNVLRGGLPIALPSRDGTTLHHVYARRHGDLERDYNFFHLPPHPLSSGAGNYRDICQNRRWDVMFYPGVRDLELRMFLELIQPDGFNPLAIKGYHWIADQAQAETLAPPGISAAQLAEFSAIITQPFQPGAVLHWLDRRGIAISDRMAWLKNLLAQCHRRLVAGGHEGGYWIDHWTYLADMLDALAHVFPDEIERMLTERPDIGWFDDGAFVRPRSAKYHQRPVGPRQLDAVTDIPWRSAPLPPVTPLGKLVGLVAIKAVSFDASCRGIEMEAGRPAWNDAMNGLPGLFGSSSCEALELGRLAAWLREHLKQIPDLVLPRPVADLVAKVVKHLSADEYDWSAECTTRESYRQAVSRDTDATTATVPATLVAQLLNLVVQRVQGAAERVSDPATGLTHTYFRNAPTKTPAGAAMAVPNESTPLPLFLEGQVHRLRLIESPDDARRVYSAVRVSPLFDSTLRMYKLNASLAGCSPSIGRARTFTPGWFENESIWLHMSYKYILEILRAGLFDEFYRDAVTMLVPFMDPRTYGRSILENSSFLGSCANPDPATHGRGFIARLSGSTAEFIHMWLLMTIGPRPFRLDQGGELEFAPQPALPGEWFTTKNTSITWNDVEHVIPANAFGCALLGHTMLVYHNESRRNTFGSDAVMPVRYQIDGGKTVSGVCLDAAQAHRLRDRQIKRIDVWLE
ncbi:MAG: hypothetical protein JXO22_00465 [Phycisphaerae bacterium]|nr:hypothetical protein [Phycisphaerae bacterium]